MDHKNSTFLTSDNGCERILRQRLVIEQFGVEIKYIKGTSNLVADTLSRLLVKQSRMNKELFLNQGEFQDTVTFPLHINHIKDLQQDNKQLEWL